MTTDTLAVSVKTLVLTGVGNKGLEVANTVAAIGEIVGVWTPAEVTAMVTVGRADWESVIEVNNASDETS